MYMLSIICILSIIDTLSIIAVIDIRNVIDNWFDVDKFSFACWKFCSLLYLILILYEFLAVHGQTSSHRKRGPIHSEAKWKHFN